MPILVPPPTPVTPGTLAIAWVTTAGVVHDLTGSTSPLLFARTGMTGLGLPPLELVLEKLPGTPGSVLRYTRTREGRIKLPLYVEGTDFNSLLTKLEDLRAWFDTGNERDTAPGYLRITRPQDGAVREIACYYESGLEGDFADGGWAAEPVVTLVAPDPYWSDVTETVQVYTQADLAADRSVINLGDFDAYPVWRITGPAANLNLTNVTANKFLAFTSDGGLTLAAGDVLTVDTRPAPFSDLQVSDQDGNNLFSKLTAGSALWWLQPGQNHFFITATGTDGNTEFQLSWLPRYRGVLR